MFINIRKLINKRKHVMLMIKWRGIARDTLALGSIPFYSIVIIRAIIGKYLPFIYQLSIAFIILFIFSKLLKNSNQHIARGLILAVFTSVFYKEIIFTIFAAILFFAMIVSLFYLKVKRNELLKGIISGIVSTAVSYQATSWL